MIRLLGPVVLLACGPGERGEPPPPPAPEPSMTSAPACVQTGTPPPDDWLFDVTGSTLPRFDVAMSRAAEEELRAWGDTFVATGEKPDGGVVEGAVTIRSPDGTQRGPYRVSLNLRGKPGSSFSPIDGKPYLHIQFDAFCPGQDLDGHHALRLYNQWQDVGQVGRYLGYKVWRDRGYPAPRAGFGEVWLTVDGAPEPRALGLYGTTETVDQDFLTRWTDELGTISQLYEGEYGNDLVAGASDLEEKVGNGDRTALDALVATLDGARTRAELEEVLHVDRFLRYWALEIAVGAREGYASQLNNYYLAIDDEGKGTFLPWGFDQVLYDELPIDGTDAVIPGLPFLRADLRDALSTELDAIPWRALSGEQTRVLDLLDVPGEGREGNRLLFPSGLTPAYQASEIPSAERNMRWYLDRAPAHLRSDLDLGL